MGETRSAHAKAVTLGPAAPALRRRLGPLAWCALEVLCERATLTDRGLNTEVSVLALAGELGVANNTAHRALKALRSVGLVEHSQARASSGRFDTSSYRLTIPDNVLTRQLPRAAGSRRPRGSRSAARGLAVAAVPGGGFDEQLVLLPLA